MTKTTFITGVTSGIGKATAELLAQNGYRIIGTGRRKERLEELEKTIAPIAPIITLNFDVRDREAVNQSIESLPKNWRNIDLLVNNAGNAHGLASIQDGKIDDWDAMIDINVKGLLYVSKAIMPLMIDQGSGHIINIGSVAGREVYEKGNVYCASKFAVDAISKAMRIDLNEHRIKVSQIAPGLVETEFSLVRFKGDAKRAEPVYKGFDALQPQDIADLIWYMASRPSHVNIADVLVFPTAQATSKRIKKDV